MSQMIEGIEHRERPRPIRTAAAVILVRGDGLERELYWVRRGPRVSFSGGYHAFPGGKVDPGDAHLPIANCPKGEQALRGCALRELFEETGVLFTVEPPPRPEALRTMRTELLAGADFGQQLAGAQLTLEGGALLACGRWLTPPFSTIRFDAHFFLASVGGDDVGGDGAGIVPQIVAGELIEGGWVRPVDALAQWERGEVLLHPPNHHAIATLAGFAPEAAVSRLRHPPYMGPDHVVERIEFQRGILMLPLRTPTLPPATHTNCYVVGTGQLAVVDPGSPQPTEQARLLRFLAELETEGREVSCVLLTHHHHDHTQASQAVAKRFRVPVRGSAATAQRVDGCDGGLGDGDWIDLDGPRPMRLECLLTEGHAVGHLAFQEPISGAVLAGDLVASGSTIVIDPPEGDMGVYLASLERLRQRDIGTLYPAHGFPIRDGKALLTQYLAHRQARIEQIQATLGAAAQEVAGIVARVYTDTPRELLPVAARSALASLLELERRGRAVRSAAGWCAVES